MRAKHEHLTASRMPPQYYATGMLAAAAGCAAASCGT
jgi:hypothetical protein